MQVVDAKTSWIRNPRSFWEQRASWLGSVGQLADARVARAARERVAYRFMDRTRTSLLKLAGNEHARCAAAFGITVYITKDVSSQSHASGDR